MIEDAERKLARVTAALERAVRTLRLHELPAPVADASESLAVLTDGDRANLENSDLYWVAEIEAQMRTFGVIDSEHVWWLLARVEDDLLEAATRRGEQPPDGVFGSCSDGGSASAGWEPAKEAFLAGFLAGGRIEKERADFLEAEVERLRGPIAIPAL